MVPRRPHSYEQYGAPGDTIFAEPHGLSQSSLGGVYSIDEDLLLYLMGRGLQPVYDLLVEDGEQYTDDSNYNANHVVPCTVVSRLLEDEVSEEDETHKAIPS